MYQFGISAESVEEVRDVSAKMENIGTDFIGMMTGMSYEWGINEVNQKAFTDTGVNVITVGTVMNDMPEEAIERAVKQFLHR